MTAAVKNQSSTDFSQSPLQPGIQAPEFKLSDQDGNLVELSSLRGHPVILAFYPRDFTAVCGSQLALYNEVLPLFREHAAQLIGISVDSVKSHQAFSMQNGFQFPLLADDQPLGQVARAFGVFNEAKARCERALFVLDARGDVAWSYVSPSGVNPGANGILDALERLP